MQSTNRPPRDGSSSASISDDQHGFVERGPWLRSRTPRARARRRRCTDRAACLATKRSWFQTSSVSIWPKTSTSPRHAGRLAQPRMDHDAPLRVDLRGLAEVVDAVEELAAGPDAWRARGELFFERQPDRHRVDADVLPRQARHEQLRAVLLLDERTEGVRDLEPPFVINFGGVVAPKHDCLLHFAPQKSTAIVEKRPPLCQPQNQEPSELTLNFRPAKQRANRRRVACYDVQICSAKTHPAGAPTPPMRRSRSRGPPSHTCSEPA